jgi:hypothetical protein
MHRKAQHLCSDMSKRRIGKSYCTVTGLKVSRRIGRMVEFESPLELDLITILEFSPIVETFEEQPITIRWIDAGGKEHPYTSDFLVRFRGQRFLRKGSTDKPWLVEVKPWKRLAELPGTTFSSSQDLHDYRPAEKACITLKEFDSWPG